MGRHPKPTPLRLLEGNREHRTIHDELEPKPDKVAPSCPRELAGDARKAWRYLVKELGKMGCLASSDRAQMAAYSRAWGNWCSAERALKKMSVVVNEAGKETIVSPEVIPNERGSLSINPWFKVANQSMADVVRYGAELGLNPVQRTRVKLEKPAAQSRRGKLLA